MCATTARHTQTHKHTHTHTHALKSTLFVTFECIFQFPPAQGLRLSSSLFYRALSLVRHPSSQGHLSNDGINGSCIVLTVNAQQNNSWDGYTEMREKFPSACGHTPIGLELNSTSGRAMPLPQTILTSETPQPLLPLLYATQALAQHSAPN